MKPLAILVLVLTIFAGCKSSQHGHSTKIKKNSDFQLTLHHVGCRGYCPDYKFIIDADGKASYEGLRSIDRMGQWEKQLSKAEVQKLLDCAHQHNFWGFESVYGGGLADIPYVVTQIQLDGETKRVENYRECPEGLKKLEAELEQIIGQEGWTRIEN